MNFSTFEFFVELLFTCSKAISEKFNHIHFEIPGKFRIYDILISCVKIVECFIEKYEFCALIKFDL